MNILFALTNYLIIFYIYQNHIYFHVNSFLKLLKPSNTYMIKFYKYEKEKQIIWFYVTFIKLIVIDLRVKQIKIFSCSN